MKAIVRTVGAYPILWFTILACFFGWIFFIAAVLGANLVPLNLPLAPVIAAAVVAALMGRTDWTQWIRALGRWRTSPGWYILALVAPFVVVGAAVLANGGLGAPFPTSSQLAAWTGLPLTFAFMLVFIGLGEEAGWTAFAAPRLLAGSAFLPAWAILSAIRILWHLPLMLTGDLSWVLGIGGNAAFQFLVLWIFLRSGGVWLLAAIWHAVLNTLGGEFFFPLVQGADQARLGFLMTAGYVLLAAIVFLVERHHLRRILQAPSVLS